MSGWLIPLLVGAATGVLSGFGVGGGTLLLVYMTTLAGLDQHLAQGINLLYFLPAGLTALPAHLKNGYVEKGLLFPAISAGLLCAALASWAATALDVDLLRKLFGGFLILHGCPSVRSGKRENVKAPGISPRPLNQSNPDRIPPEEDSPSFWSICSRTRHVGGDVHSIPLKELIQLLLEAFHHLAHHPLDPAHGGGNVLPLYALGLQLGIGRRIFRVVGR